MTTTTTISAATPIPCEGGRRRCYRPATKATHTFHVDGRRWEGRCGIHAAADRRRDADTSELTAEIATEIRGRLAEQAARQVEAAAERRAKHEQAAEAARRQAWVAYATEVPYARNDRDGDPDWTATREAGGDLVLGPSHPRWMTDRSVTPYMTEVELTIPSPDWPQTVRVRASSELTVPEARTLYAMLGEALEVLDAKD